MCGKRTPRGGGGLLWRGICGLCIYIYIYIYLYSVKEEKEEEEEEEEEESNRISSSITPSFHRVVNEMTAADLSSTTTRYEVQSPLACDRMDKSLARRNSDAWYLERQRVRERSDIREPHLSITALPCFSIVPYPNLRGDCQGQK